MSYRTETNGTQVENRHLKHNYNPHNLIHDFLSNNKDDPKLVS